MNLDKKECPLKIKIDCDAGWSEVQFNYQDKILHFLISYCFDEQLDDLLETLYYLNPNVCDTADPNERLFEEWKEVVHKTGGYHYAYLSSSFMWNEEPAANKWTISRDFVESGDKEWDYSFNLHIKIAKLTDPDWDAEKSPEVYSFDIKYCDFCYAVAKAITEMIKKYGFYGYHMSTYNQDLNMRYLLSIKSIALNNFEAVQLNNLPNNDGCASIFEKELELLMFDM